jgi:hypothetical protein
MYPIPPPGVAAIPSGSDRDDMLLAKEADAEDDVTRGRQRCGTVTEAEESVPPESRGSQLRRTAPTAATGRLLELVLVVQLPPGPMTDAVPGEWRPIRGPVDAKSATRADCFAWPRSVGDLALPVPILAWLTTLL